MDHSDAGLMFSSTILRVVNLIAESSRRSSGDSLYQLADAAQLPDWVINLRHDIAHGGSLPNTETLRLAATFALQWIKTYYWDVECDAYNDIIIEESAAKVFKRNISGLISSYVDMSNPDRDQLNTQNLDHLSLKSALSTIAPWILPPKVGFPHSGCNSMDSIVGHLTSYLNKPQFISETYPIFVSQLCLHTNEEKGISPETWAPLIDYINKKQLLGKLLKFMCQESVSAARDIWIRSIAYAISWKQKVDDERRRILSSIPFKHGPEAKVAEHITLTKKLKLSPDCTEIEIVNKLFTQIEKQHNEFAGAIRLNDSVNYVKEECAILCAIQALVAQPYGNIYHILDVLFPMVEPKMGEKTERQIKALIGLFLGERGIRPTSKKIYTIDDLPGIDSQMFSLPMQHEVVTGPDAEGPQKFYRYSAPVTFCLDVSELVHLESPREDVQPCNHYFPLS